MENNLVQQLYSSMCFFKFGDQQRRGKKNKQFNDVCEILVDQYFVMSQDLGSIAVAKLGSTAIVKSHFIIKISSIYEIMPNNTNAKNEKQIEKTFDNNPPKKQTLEIISYYVLKHNSNDQMIHRKK